MIVLQIQNMIESVVAPSTGTLNMVWHEWGISVQIHTVHAVFITFKKQQSCSWQSYAHTSMSPASLQIDRIVHSGYFNMYVSM